MELAQGEKVVAEPDSLFRRRDERRRTEEGDRAEHELWQASVERYNARQEREMRAGGTAGIVARQSDTDGPSRLS